MYFPTQNIQKSIFILEALMSVLLSFLRNLDQNQGFLSMLHYRIYYLSLYDIINYNQANCFIIISE